MTIQKYNGSILRRGGSIANSQDCCCDPPLYCYCNPETPSIGVIFSFEGAATLQSAFYVTNDLSGTGEVKCPWECDCNTSLKNIFVPLIYADPLWCHCRFFRKELCMAPADAYFPSCLAYYWHQAWIDIYVAHCAAELPTGLSYKEIQITLTIMASANCTSWYSSNRTASTIVWSKVFTTVDEYCLGEPPLEIPATSSQTDYGTPYTPIYSRGWENCYTYTWLPCIFDHTTMPTAYLTFVHP